MRQLRQAIRLLARHPSFTLASILTLALGIGATTAIFSILYSLLLKPPPFPEPERLFNLMTAAPRFGYTRAFVGAANLNDWKAQSGTFEGMAFYRPVANYNLTGAGMPERLQGARFSANLLDVLGIRPMLGRNFLPEEQLVEGRTNVCILTYPLWVRRFGGDASIVGKKILLNSAPYEVIGVMGPDFHFPAREFQIFAPHFVPRDEMETRLGYNYVGIGRLKRGVTLRQAQSEMDTIAQRLGEQFPATNKGIGVVVEPLDEAFLETVRPTLILLMAAVGCLLLIACANLTNLMLSRTLARSREFALRASLGAGRGGLATQLLGEMAPVAIAGCGGGILFAAWAIDAILPFLPAGLPRVDAIGLHPAVLFFSASLSLLTLLLIGLFPVLQVGRVHLFEALKQDSRTSTQRSGRVRSALALVQIAVAVMLVAGSGLLIRSFLRLAEINPGFRSQGALTLHLAIPRAKHPQDRDVAAFLKRMLEEVRTLPGVESAGAVNRLPLSGQVQTGALQFSGSRGTVDIGNLDWRTVTPGYFRSMGIPLVRGRDFTDFDVEGKTTVGIIDETIAAKVFPNEDPIGKRFRIALGSVILPWVEIVGIVGHIRHDTLERSIRPQAYWNYQQRAQDRMALVVRTSGRPMDLAAGVVARIHAVDPEQPVYDVRSMEEVVDRSLAQRRLSTTVLALFAAGALGLAGLGVFAVIAFSVQARLREYAIRIALGAQQRQIRHLILSQAGSLALSGVALGLVAAFWASRLLSQLVYGIGTHDPGTFAGSAVLLAAVVLAGAWIPARRAMKTDPMTTLRQE